MADNSFVIALEYFLILLIVYGFIILINYAFLEMIYAYKNETAKEIAKYHINCMRKDMHNISYIKKAYVSCTIDIEKNFYPHTDNFHESFYGNQRYAKDVFKNPWIISCNLIFQPSYIESRPFIYHKTIMCWSLLSGNLVKRDYIDDSFDISKQKYIKNCKRLKPYLKMSLVLKRHIDKGLLQTQWHDGVPNCFVYDYPYLKRYFKKKIEYYTKFNVFLDFLYWMFIEKIIILQHKIFKK